MPPEEKVLALLSGRIIDQLINIVWGCAHNIGQRVLV